MKKRRSKYPKRPVFRPANEAERADFYARTDARAPLEAGQTVAGFARHPDTGCYQVWLSTNGLDVVSVSAHRQEGEAERDLQALKACLGSQDYYNGDAVAALLKSLEAGSDAPLVPFPDEEVRRITHAILCSFHGQTTG